jgi:hypothetical protein
MAARDCSYLNIFKHAEKNDNELATGLHVTRSQQLQLGQNSCSGLCQVCWHAVVSEIYYSFYTGFIADFLVDAANVRRAWRRGGRGGLCSEVLRPAN